MAYMLTYRKICLGEDWQTAAFVLTRTSVCSADFLVSLIGAAIFSRVLASIPWCNKPVITYRSEYHKLEAERYMREQGM